MGKGKREWKGDYKQHQAAFTLNDFQKCCDFQARDVNKDNATDGNTFEEGKEQIYTKESKAHEGTIRILRWTG